MLTRLSVQTRYRITPNNHHCTIPRICTSLPEPGVDLAQSLSVQERSFQRIKSCRIRPSEFHCLKGRRRSLLHRTSCLLAQSRIRSSRCHERERFSPCNRSPASEPNANRSLTCVSPRHRLMLYRGIFCSPSGRAVRPSLHDDSARGWLPVGRHTYCELSYHGAG